MGSMYRILIESGDGETVADLTAPVEMLAQFAPEAVARLLREATPEAGEQSVPANRDYLIGATDQPSKERRRRRTKAEIEAARAAEQHPAPDISTDPIPAEVVPDTSIDRNTYNPFGPK